MGATNSSPPESGGELLRTRSKSGGYRNRVWVRSYLVVYLFGCYSGGLDSFVGLFIYCLVGRLLAAYCFSSLHSSLHGMNPFSCEYGTSNQAPAPSNHNSCDPARGQSPMTIVTETSHLVSTPDSWNHVLRHCSGSNSNTAVPTAEEEQQQQQQHYFQRSTKRIRLASPLRPSSLLLTVSGNGRGRRMITPQQRLTNNNNNNEDDIDDDDDDDNINNNNNCSTPPDIQGLALPCLIHCCSNTNTNHSYSTYR
jgi:hypothetical protein